MYRATWPPLRSCRCDREGGVGMHEQTSITERLLASLLEMAREARVSDVCIGLGYTAVMLEGDRLGVAFTFSDQARGGCSIFQGIRPLAGRPAADLLVLLQSSDPIEVGVGLACANALANHPEGDVLEGDVLDQVDLEPEDHVGMVGHFGPLIHPLQKRVKQVTVFERVSQPEGLLRPQEEATEVLPQCQVALITATSLINSTAEGLLRAAAACREVVLLGPSTPLLAEVYGDHNVTLLSGVVVVDPAAVLRVVAEGGGMRQFSPFVRKISIKITAVKTGGVSL